MDTETKVRYIKEYEQYTFEKMIDLYKNMKIQYEVIKDTEGYIVDVIRKDEEELEENEIWHNEVISKRYSRPMPINCLGEKKYAAKEYAALMVISNMNPKTGERYLYRNKFDINELANDLKISRTTLERNIKKLEKLDCNILRIRNVQKKGIVYDLIYGEQNEETGVISKYVTINQKMLKELIFSFDTDAIKIYCLIKSIANECIFIPITEKYICEKIGLNGNSCKNKTKIRTIIKTLEKCKYIETKKENFYYWDENKQKKVPQISKSFRICTFEEWNKLDEKMN